MQNKIKEIEKKYNVKVVLFTKAGSHLYGTETKDSDVDYKGLFLPSLPDLLKDNSLEFLDYSTNKTNEKNTKDDIDFTLQSVQKWTSDCLKGETGALDLLFSCFTNPTFIDNEFLDYISNNYKDFLSKKPNAFIGYANQQAKKYSLKKDRYQEIKNIIQELHDLTKDNHSRMNLPMKAFWPEIKNLINNNSWKYSSIVMAAGPKKHIEEEYLEILGRKFHPSVKLCHVLGRLEKVEKDYGNRAKRCDSPTEWKSLSHAVRVMDEIIELLETRYITFPLKNTEFIKNVKLGKIKQEEVSAYLQSKLDNIDELIEKSELPDEPVQDVMLPYFIKHYLGVSHV
jgi:predicted nucleotidyltransferase